MGTITFKKQATPPPPATNQVRLFVDAADSTLKSVDSAGSVTVIGSGGGSGSSLSVTSVKNGPNNYLSSAGDLVLTNPISGSVTVRLPSSPSANAQIGIKIVGLASNPVHVDPNGSGTIDGSSTLDLTVDYEWALLVFDDTNNNWIQIG